MMLNISAQLTNWKMPAGEVGEFFYKYFLVSIFFFFGESCSMYCPGETSFSIRCRRNTSERMMPDLIKISQKYPMSGFVKILFDKNIPCEDFFDTNIPYQDLGRRLSREPTGLDLLELEGPAKAMKTWIGICGSETMTMTIA